MSQFDPPVQSQGYVRAFRLTEQRVRPGCLEIEVEGELDLAVSDQLRDALNLAQADPCHVMVGFDACSFIDSSGLEVLVAANRSLTDRDRQLLLHGVRGQVRRMLSITGLAESFELAAVSPGWAVGTPEQAARFGTRLSAGN